MTELDRRKFLLGSAHLAGWAALFGLAQRTHAWAGSARLTARDWAKRLGDIAQEVQCGKLAPTEWQRAIEELHAQVPLEEIIHFVDVDAVLARVKAPAAKLEAVERIDWPLESQDVGHLVFVYRKGDCTPPHGHDGLVSAHLVLEGQIRARTFDRLEDLQGAFLLRPTADHVAGPGATTSMSRERDNVHWFEGVSARAVSFDVPVSGIPGGPARDDAGRMSRIYVDPRVRARSDGKLEAPIISYGEAVKRFG